MCERMLFLKVLAVNGKALSNYFTRAERLLCCSSVLLIALSAEVRVDRLKRGEGAVMLALAAAVTAAFSSILRAFHTADLGVNPLSVATSFPAVYLAFRRNPRRALAYAANGLVPIALWGLASLTDPSYLSAAICFAMFLAGDLYVSVNWRRVQVRQSEARGSAKRAPPKGSPFFVGGGRNPSLFDGGAGNQSIALSSSSSSA